MAKVISLEAARKRKIQRKASPTQEEILKICEQLIREMEQNPICDEECRDRVQEIMGEYFG